jgi:hypothetical protein
MLNTNMAILHFRILPFLGISHHANPKPATEITHEPLNSHSADSSEFSTMSTDIVRRNIKVAFETNEDEPDAYDGEARSWTKFFKSLSESNLRQLGEVKPRAFQAVAPIQNHILAYRYNLDVAQHPANIQRSSLDLDRCALLYPRSEKHNLKARLTLYVALDGKLYRPNTELCREFANAWSKHPEILRQQKIDRFGNLIHIYTLIRIDSWPLKKLKTRWITEKLPEERIELFDKAVKRMTGSTIYPVRFFIYGPEYKEMYSLARGPSTRIEGHDGVLSSFASRRARNRTVLVHDASSHGVRGMTYMIWSVEEEHAWLKTLTSLYDVVEVDILIGGESVKGFTHVIADCFKGEIEPSM